MKPRLAQYADVRAVLDAALAADGGFYVCESHGAAVRFRHRIYEFRKKYAESIIGESPYDSLTMPRIPPDSCEVEIKKRQVIGRFIPNRKAEILADDMEIAAHRLAQQIDEGDIL